MKPALSATALSQGEALGHTVRVRLFARIKDIAGADTIAVDLPDRATVGALRGRLAAAFPALGTVLSRSAVAVNGALADDATLVPAGAEIALLPPVSGG